MQKVVPELVEGESYSCEKRWSLSLSKEKATHAKKGGP